MHWYIQPCTGTSKPERVSFLVGCLIQTTSQVAVFVKQHNMHVSKCGEAHLSMGRAIQTRFGIVLGAVYLGS